MGHHALVPGIISLLVGGEQWLKWEWMWRRGDVGGLRGKGLKASMRNITIGKGEVL